MPRGRVPPAAGHQSRSSPRPVVGPIRPPRAGRLSRAPSHRRAGSGPRHAGRAAPVRVRSPLGSARARVRRRPAASRADLGAAGCPGPRACRIIRKPPTSAIAAGTTSARSVIADTPNAITSSVFAAARRSARAGLDRVGRHGPARLVAGALPKLTPASSRGAGPPRRLQPSEVAAGGSAPRLGAAQAAAHLRWPCRTIAAFRGLRCQRRSRGVAFGDRGRTAAGAQASCAVVDSGAGVGRTRRGALTSLPTLRRSRPRPRRCCPPSRGRTASSKSTSRRAGGCSTAWRRGPRRCSGGSATGRPVIAGPDRAHRPLASSSGAPSPRRTLDRERRGHEVARHSSSSPRPRRRGARGRAWRAKRGPPRRRGRPPTRRQPARSGCPMRSSPSGSHGRRSGPASSCGRARSPAGSP